MDMESFRFRYVLHATTHAGADLSAHSTCYFNKYQPFGLEQKSLAGKMVKPLWVFCSTLQKAKLNDVLIISSFLKIMLVGKEEQNTARGN